MALEDEVEDRYGAQFLVNLTNPYSPSATTLDAARLLLAVTDLEADFQTHAQVEFDIDDPRMVSIGVEGVIILLKVRSGLEKDSLYKSFIKDRLVPLSLVTSRDRVGPVTSSPLSEPPEESGQPSDFTRRRFRDVLPDEPLSRGEGDIDRTE